MHGVQARGVDKRWRRVGAALLVAALLALQQAAAGAAPGPVTAASAAATADPDVVPDQYIVALRGEADSRTEAAEAVRVHGVALMHVYGRALRGFSFRGTAHAARALARNPRVAAVVPDRRFRAAAQTVPTGVARIAANVHPVAQVDGVDNRLNVNVAIVDTGIDDTHPDLQVVGGTNCVTWDGSASSADLSGHGTHVAGTVGALDNDVGVVGVAPGVRLWAVRVLDAVGAGTTSSIVCGIDWITGTRGDADPGNDIAVANMSLGGANGGNDGNCGFTVTDLLHQAICRSVAVGVAYVVAAGNSQSNASTEAPAAYPEVITVSAMRDYDGAPGAQAAATCRAGQDDAFASDFSNWGPPVDIAAPGVCILSTWRGGGYATQSGTSMAAPHVSGAAALHIASRGAATTRAEVDAIRELLTAPGQGGSVRQGDRRGFTGDVSVDSCHEPMLYLGTASGPTVHDVAVSTLTGGTTLTAGASAAITVGLSNEGEFVEMLIVTITDDTTGLTLDQRSLGLAAGKCAIFRLDWNSTGAVGGTHVVAARVAPVSGETTTIDNIRSTTFTINDAPAPTPADTVAVTRVECVLSKQELRVEATSTDPTAVLSVYATATGALIGSLTGVGGGNYRGQFTCPSGTQSITVRSSRGGSATAAISAK